MINWNDLKNFDLTDVDFDKLDLSRFDVRNIELPDIDLPDFEAPDFEMPKLPEIDVPVERVAGLARDAAYAGVGAVVVGAQRAEERRREMTDQVTTQVRRLIDAVG